jgi:hypothetical protein
LQLIAALQIIDFERWRYLATKPGFGSLNGSVDSITDSRHKRFMDVQANTYAFGVILLKLISGRASVSKDTGGLSGLGNFWLFLTQAAKPAQE